MKPTSTSLICCLRKMVAPQSCADASDPQLLEKFLAQHSEAAFAALVRRHGPMVLNVCRRVLGHDQDAEDAFQAAFLVLARKAGSIRKHESVGSWLHGVAYRVARMCKTKESRRLAWQRGMPLPPHANTQDDIHWHELRCLLDEELGKLPEKYRAPLVLCYLEGRTRDEAASQLAVSKAVFRRRLEYGRERLGRQLARRGITLSAALSAPLLTDAVTQAGLPPLLMASTIRVGMATASGQAVVPLVSAHVAALVEGSVASLVAKKASIALVLLVMLALGIGGLLAQRAVSGRTHAEAPVAPAPQSPPARSASKGEALSIKGRVLDPDGKPLAGARLIWRADGAAKKADTAVRATTDKDGLFHFTAMPTEFDPQGKATLAAAAKGLGPDWIDISLESKDDLTLRLVKDDIPVEGRVLDLEGQPVAGVRVRVVRFMQGDVDAWIEGTRRKKYPQIKNRISPETLGEAATAVTGKDGRFRLTGLGRDRVMHVLLEGDSIERGDFEVVTRLEVPKELSHGNNGVYPARFNHVAGPGKSITGTIRDKRTSKPLAGISVACPVTPSGIWATTDAQGRYRLAGVPKHKEYWVAAGGLPYFNCTKFGVLDTPGLEPVTVDIALERGLIIQGKLLDKVTGKPVRGRVSYISLPDNPNLKDFTDLNKPQAVVSDSGKTKADGSFLAVAIPGPGLLVASADDGKHYLAAVLPEPSPRISNILESYHAIVRVNPSEKEPESTRQNVYLEPARTLNGTVVGPDGKPLAGARYAGLSGTLDLSFGRSLTMETASFTAGGVSPKRPRNIVFVHAGKKLAKVQQIRGEETDALTVRLEPLGAVKGRILDAAGRPRAGLQVTIALSLQKSDYKDLPLELLYEYPTWSKILNRKATTDAEGRFHIEGLVPGLKYLQNVKDEGKIVESLTRTIDALESEKTKDLGDLKSKMVPEKGVQERR